MTTTSHDRDEPLTVLVTSQEFELIRCAAEAAGTDLTSFALGRLTEAARRVLADRDRFLPSAEQAEAWDQADERPAKELAGLRRLAERPSPLRRVRMVDVSRNVRHTLR